MLSVDTLSIGNLIMAHRLSVGMSKIDLAKELGVTRATIWHWETDRHQPQWHQFARMVVLLDMDPVVLGAAIARHIDRLAADIRRRDSAGPMSQAGAA